MHTTSRWAAPTQKQFPFAPVLLSKTTHTFRSLLDPYVQARTALRHIAQVHKQPPSYTCANAKATRTIHGLAKSRGLFAAPLQPLVRTNLCRFLDNERPCVNENATCNSYFQHIITFSRTHPRSPPLCCNILIKDRHFSPRQKPLTCSTTIPIFLPTYHACTSHNLRSCYSQNILKTSSWSAQCILYSLQISAFSYVYFRK